MNARRRCAARAGIAVLCLQAAACAGPAPQPAVTGDAASGAETVRQPAPEAVSEPARNAETAALPPPPDPDSLVGMTGAKVTGLFGNPVFVRRDPPGEFWRYRSKTCVLELYFYRRDGDWRVDHIEMRRGSEPVADRPACLATLQRQPGNG